MRVESLPGNCTTSACENTRAAAAARTSSIGGAPMLSARSRLHGLAVSIIERAFDGHPPAAPSAELASGAEAAVGTEGAEEWRRRELHRLLSAAAEANRVHASADAQRFFRRVKASPAADPGQRTEAALRRFGGWRVRPALPLAVEVRPCDRCPESGPALPDADPLETAGRLLSRLRGFRGIGPIVGIAHRIEE